MQNSEHEVNLNSIARDTLLRFGFLVETPRPALAQLSSLSEPDYSRLGYKDLTSWLWSSIDNDDSRDLDQIEYIQADPRGTRLYVAIADIDSFVASNTALDQAARHNTTSIYTGVHTYPMFPDRLSTNLTSLLEGQTRLAVVTEMLITADGRIGESSVYRAVVRNQSQLAYHAAGSWLENQPPDNSAASLRTLQKINSNPQLQEQLRGQHKLAQALREKRLEAGALTFETIEVKPELADGGWELKAARHNAATKLIEDFMIVANQAVVGFLQSKGFPSIRRVVRTPKNWPQIVTLAAQHGAKLPTVPDPKPLEDFLIEQHKKDPDHFPDLSLAIIKLLGRGEYIVSTSGCNDAPGHFGLAVECYTHSTAPNRRYPDVITQRLLLASLAGHQPPYTAPVLDDLAEHCTQKEDDANKAERSVHKSIAAAAMAHRVGEKFEGMITGAADKGTWVRLVNPPIEGRLGGAVRGLAVGDRVIVKLVSTDPWRGFIDFNLIARH